MNFSIDRNIFKDKDNFSEIDYQNCNKYIYDLIKNYNPHYLNFILNNDRSKFRKISKNSNLKIMFFIDLKSFLFKMSRVRFWAIEELAKNNNIDLFYFGLNWPKYDDKLSIQKNIKNLNVKIDIIIWYKPLDTNLIFDKNEKLNSLTVLRYNEMWDEEWTKKEIIESNTDIIICHHKNDFDKYNNLFSNSPQKFFYNPHHSNPNIFFKQKRVKKDIDILISGVVKEKHYPLKFKIFNCLKKYEKTFLRNYNIHFHNHPGYNHYDSFTNKNQIEYNNLINRSKICIVCSSKHNYRLGKYVEIPMAGGVMCGDLPYEDKENFKKIMIEINYDMNEQKILTILINSINNIELLNEKSKLGIEWAKNYSSKKYSNRLVTIFSKLCFKKVFIISDEIQPNHPEFKNEKWICDIIKQEFHEKYPLVATNNINEADIIWYLAPWNQRFLPKRFDKTKFLKLLEEKFVIATIHHVDKEKYDKNEYKQIFDFTEKYANRYHCICNETRKFLKKINISKPIDTIYQWINDKIFFDIPNNENIKKKYNIPSNHFVIGSFQKDTEGKNNQNIPKLSKGPDVFLNIAIDLNKQHSNFLVILTGLRREYLIENFKKYNIKYLYFNMVSLEEINELYNCLDLYIISSRYEGGPRSVFEAGITKTPLISTKVGIANELVPIESLFNVNDFITYKNAKPNKEKLYNTINNLKYDEQVKYMNNYFQTCINKKENINQFENCLLKQNN